MAVTSSLVVGVKAPLECWPIAVDRVRYVGEPVAIVVASDRYRAEDAVDLIEMRYRPLPAVVDPVAAATADSPLLHPAINSNVVGERTFRYGDPERAFAEAAHRVRVDVRYPRNSSRRSKRTASSPNTMPVKMRNRQFPGTLQSASGHGTRAQGPGQSLIATPLRQPLVGDRLQRTTIPRCVAHPCSHFATL